MCENKKTGESYRTLFVASNKTTGHEGEKVIVYFKDKNVYVREEKEFRKKFNCIKDCQDDLEMGSRNDLIDIYQKGYCDTTKQYYSYKKRSMRIIVLMLFYQLLLTVALIILRQKGG